MVQRESTAAGRIFKFHSEAVAEETFHVVTVDGRESISRPYHMEINLTTKRKISISTASFPSPPTSG